MSALPNAPAHSEITPGAPDTVVFWLNGERTEVPSSVSHERLSTWLRNTRGLTGTKVSCGTGDCGSCTVLVATAHHEPPRWQAVNACLQFVHQLHGGELRTVEGVGTPDALTVAQDALVCRHGSQCGMCTPGLVMAITAALQDTPPATATDWAAALCGNVCRCTGYTAIVDAALHTAPLRASATADAVVPEFSPAWLTARHALHAHTLTLAGPVRVVKPATLAEALEQLAQSPASRVVAGATDVAVESDMYADAHTEPGAANRLDIGHLAELETIEMSSGPHGRRLTLGANVRWSALEKLAAAECPPLASLLRRMGSPQIRAVATVGGNIMTASPIGDLLPLLLVMNADLEFAHRDGTRRVPLHEAIVGYRQIDLRPGELLVRVHLPLPHAHEHLVLEKVSRRRDMDIATVSLAARWHVSAEGCIREIALAVGGAGPTAQRLPEVEQLLEGRDNVAATWRAAALHLSECVHPRDDVRGSAEYRRRVLGQLVSALPSLGDAARGAVSS